MHWQVVLDFWTLVGHNIKDMKDMAALNPAMQMLHLKQAWISLLCIKYAAHTESRAICNSLHNFLTATLRNSSHAP